MNSFCCCIGWELWATSVDEDDKASEAFFSNIADDDDDEDTDAFLVAVVVDDVADDEEAMLVLAFKRVAMLPLLLSRDESVSVSFTLLSSRAYSCSLLL